MATPVTPERTRPKLGPRSQTDSSPKATRTQTVGQNNKKHHIDLFGHALHRGPHHLYVKDKRNDEKAASKTNLRQLASPLTEFASRATPGDVSHKSSRQPSMEKLRNQTATREELRHEMQRSKLRDEEVRGALGKLSDTAHANARRLDLAYYSLLEKARMLRSTIASLQELSMASQEMREGFEQDSAEVERETESQIQALNGFQDERHRIEKLESRVKAGMSKAESLSSRLEAARKELDTWEARENEWQAKTSKRLTICWSCLSSFAVLILVIFIIKRLAYPSTLSVDEMSREGSKNTSMPSVIARDLAEISSKRLAAKATSSISSPVTLSRDRRLEGFDEL